MGVKKLHWIDLQSACLSKKPTDWTQCSKLDQVIKQNLLKDIKDTDSNVAWLQTLNLDAAAPLLFILDEAQKLGDSSISSEKDHPRLMSIN